MRVAALARVPGGAATASGDVAVVESWGPAPGRQFRAVAYLGFACGSLAEGVLLESAGVVLRGEFLSLAYDALHPPAPLAAAEVLEEGGILLVELDGVRRLRRIVVAGNARTRAGTLGVYRLDGEGPAAEPALTVEAAGGPFVATVGAGAYRAVASAAAHAVPAQEVAEHEASAVHGAVCFELPDGFDEVRFALRITVGGEASTLRPEDLLSAEVSSTPLNPRLGLVVSPQADSEGSDPLADLLLFWPGPASPPSPPTMSVDAGSLLEVALGNHLARRTEELRSGGALLPERLDVAVVMAADAPCRFRLDAVEVGYHLVRSSLAAPLEKVVLRFPPDRVEARDVAVVLPRGATVVSAQVEVSKSRAGGGLSGGGGGGGGGNAASPSPVAGGLAVAESGWAAQRLDLAAPLMASGLVVGVFPVAPGTEISAEVRADSNGAPAGRRVAGGTAVVGSVGVASWASVRFGEAVLLPSGPVWLCLRASRGRAVWLTGAWGAGVRAAETSAGGERVSVLRGAGALCAFRSASDAADAAGAGLGLEIEGRPVTPGAATDGRLAFDAAVALTAAAAQAGSGPVTVTARFAAEPGALLTVYPPRVVYDV